MPKSASTPTRLADRPPIYVVDDFLGRDDIRHALARYGTPAALAALGIDSSASVAGLSAELPVADDPVLARIAASIEAALGFGNELKPDMFRFRRYAIGDSHPPHLDEYATGGLHLVATALLYLTDAAEGGETVFPDALPYPVTIIPRRGRLAIWFNHRADGDPERRALHHANALVRGEKATLAYFAYAPLDRAGTLLNAVIRS